MAKSYQELMASLKAQEAPVDIPEEIPDELPAFREPPQPGTYRFRLPSAIENCFDTVEVAQRDDDGNVIMVDDPEKPGQKKAATLQRINLILDGPNALTIIQAPAGSDVVGEPFTTRISNVERKRWAGKGVPMVKVADMLYLIRALAPEARPRTNQEYIQTCLQVLPNAEFTADVEWSGFCNPKNDAQFAFQNEDGSTRYEPYKDEGQTENRKGCGERVYNNKWPKDAEGGYADRAECGKCGAWVRPFAQLARFKA